MSIKLRSHGGRYLNLDKNNKLNIDTNVDLNRSSEDLERCGSTFKLNDLQKLIHGDNQGSELLNDQGQQVSIEEQGKEYTVYIEKFGDEHQWALKASVDGSQKYVIAGLQGLRLENDMAPMGVFSMITK
ncbi:unnamed protein product [Umbelopsis vinacea]